MLKKILCGQRTDAAKKNVKSLKKFAERWKELYPFKVDQVVINKDVLRVVLTEKPERQDMVATNLILPKSIFDAMLKAKEFNVPLNTAFVQANGGIGAFEDS